MQLPTLQDRFSIIAAIPHTLEGVAHLRRILLPRLSLPEDTDEFQLPLWEEVNSALITGRTMLHGLGRQGTAKLVFDELLDIFLCLLQPQDAIRSSQQVEIESRALNTLGGTHPPVIQGDALTTEDLAPLRRLLEYTKSLDPRRNQHLVSTCLGLWTDFLLIGVLGLHPRKLDGVESVNSEALTLLDQVCAWIAGLATEPADDQLWLVARYGGSDTLRVIQDRFWEMVRIAVVLGEGPEELEVVMRDPIRSMLISRLMEHSNQLIVAYLVLNARLSEDWWTALRTAPKTLFQSQC